MTDGKEEHTPARRIRRARETAVALEVLLQAPTRQDIVAFHELHARHLRELGDEQTAARADERASQARRRAAAESVGTPDQPTVGENRSSVPGAAMEHAERVRGGVAVRVKHAQASLERADAAIRRATEGSGRTEAHVARDKAARERTAAARRRLEATGARADASALRSPPDDGGDLAGERDRAADDRERIADDRERLADDRDKRADMRDKMADRREQIAAERERMSMRWRGLIHSPPSPPHD